MRDHASLGSPAWLSVLCLFVATLFCGGDQARAASCTSNAFTMVFSPLDILSGGVLDSSATFGVNCVLLGVTSGSIGVSCGAGMSCTSNVRYMVNTANSSYKLRFELYADSGHTSVVQAGGIASPAGSYTGSAAPVTYAAYGTANFTAYGRIAAGQQTVPPGTYVWTGNNDPVVQFCSSSFLGACIIWAVDTPGSVTTATVTIPAFCSVGASSTVAFPTQGILSGAVDATGTVRVTCTNTTSYSIALSTGSNASGAVRRMKHVSAAEYVTYELYTNTGRSTVWSSSGGGLVAATGAGSEQSFTVYGRVPAQSTPKPGNYADTVAITVTY